MVDKLAGAARLVATLLAIIAGFVAIPTVNVALVLVILGLIAGLKYRPEGMIALFVVVLVLPFAGRALAIIPGIGAQLNAAALNVQVAAAAVAAMVNANRQFTNSREDQMGVVSSDNAAKPAGAANA
jgi:ABC-type molybdate transport system substrate-binding protein